MIRYTKKDFRIDTFRSGGKGGQHQNKTDSGVRITHIESGIFAECRESRHQRLNKATAFQRLALKLRPWIIETHFDKKKPERNNKVIRSYNEKRNTVKNTNGIIVVPYDKLLTRGDALDILIKEMGQMIAVECDWSEMLRRRPR